jgi:hypothetical protein
MSNETTNYAIYYLYDTGLNEKEISKKLDITLKIVKESIKNRPVEKNKKIKTTSNKVNSKDLMITQTAGKGTKSVSIMTKEASQVNDEFKKRISPTISRTAKNSIFRPNK